MLLKYLQKSQINIFADKHFFDKVAGWKPETVRSSHWKCSAKKVFLKMRTFISLVSSQNRCSWIIHKIRNKKSVLGSLFNKVTVLGTCNVIKEDSDTGAFLLNLQTF